VPRLPACAAETPLDHLSSFDLSTPVGMALLRRFDARLRHLGDVEARRAAVRRLSCQVPLANRGTGLLVLPGGALALRREEAILVCDPASAIALAGEAAQTPRQGLAALPGPAPRSVVHEAEGVRALPRLPPVEGAQTVVLLETPGALGALLPETAQWRGPALLRWGAGGVVVWEMVPAPSRLALGASVVGEPLPENAAVPREVWDAPTGDDRYQLLSTGLFAHLDELLGNEVSDFLRYALVDHWTDGEESLASQLADGLGLLPACFGAPFDQPAGLIALADWPAAAAAATAAPLAVLGIGPAQWGAAWMPERRGEFLRAMRAALPEGKTAWLLTEAPDAAPLPLMQLGADRAARQAAGPFAVLLPLSGAPLDLLLLGHSLAQSCGAAVQLAAPAWGLCHSFDPLGGATRGNGGWYGLGGGLEDLAEGL